MAAKTQIIGLLGKQISMRIQKRFIVERWCAYAWNILFAL